MSTIKPTILALAVLFALYQGSAAQETVYGRQFGWVGGNKGGTAFDDGVGASPVEFLIRLCIKSGSRVDQINFITTKRTLVHGGSGGSERCWFPSQIVSYKVCWGTKNGSVRVFRLEFKTVDNKTLAGGKETSQCASYTLPPGATVVGMVGRAGGELDRFGLSFFI